MKPGKFFLTPFCAVVLFGALLAGCPNPIVSNGGSALTIAINNNINARTLLPSIDMNTASFTVNGTGPGGATFSQTTSGAPVTVDGLAFGTWSVTVNALNAAGTIIGSGQATVTVHTGQTTTVAISVVPLEGNGTLNLTVIWTASQVEIPSIQASLMPPSGTATPLSFSVSGNQATYSSTTIPAGYQTLTVQLLDNGIAVMGAVEVVRIVAGQTTTGTYAFTNVNQPGGSVQVNITPAMADPIPVSIGGVGATITAGTSVTATASVGDRTTGVVYVWYLNGVSVGTGDSLTFGNALVAGYYRLDVTAYTADGTRAGSTTQAVQVTTATAGGAITTVAGNGTQSYSGDGGPAASAGLNAPFGVAVDAAGNIYIADTLNAAIRKVSTGGTITTVAGTGTGGYSGDEGVATSGNLSLPSGVAVDLSGNIYIADTANHRILKVSTSGTFTTVAGHTPMGSGYSGDGGAATSATLYAPRGVAVDASGNIYIADTYNERIRMVSTSGIITTVAGTGTPGFSGDGGAATSAELNSPIGVAVDTAGNLYIGDTNNACIRKVSASGTITTVAGTGTPGYSGDGGPAISATLRIPWQVAVDTSGNIYIADSYNHRIRKVSTSGTITTVAGSGTPGYSGDDGPATSAALFDPSGVAVDASGVIYVADTYNHRIREVWTPKGQHAKIGGK